MLVVFRPGWIWTTFWQWTAFRAVNWWARYCRRQDWWSVPVREWIKCSTTVLLWRAKLCMWLFNWLLQESNNLIEPAVSSAVAYGRCITSNGLVLSCSDNEALPKGEIWTVRGKQLLLVSYSRGARLDGMNNKCELLLKHRDCRKAKDYWQALPKGMQSVNPLDAGITRTLVLPVKRQILTHLIVTYTEHGKPVSLLNYRTVNRKVSLWGCGYGIAEKANAILVMRGIWVESCLWIKWNNITHHESGQTSALGNSLQETFRTF